MFEHFFSLHYFSHGIIYAIVKNSESEFEGGGGSGEGVRE